jgi:hypothetical protein
MGSIAATYTHPHLNPPLEGEEVLGECFAKFRIFHARRGCRHPSRIEVTPSLFGCPGFLKDGPH